MSTIMSIPFTVVTDVRVFRLAWKYNTVLETQLRYFRAPSLRPLRLSYSRCTELVYPECWHFDNDATSKIDDVLTEHGGLLYFLPLAVHLRFILLDK